MSAGNTTFNSKEFQQINNTQSNGQTSSSNGTDSLNVFRGISYIKRPPEIFKSLDVNLQNDIENINSDNNSIANLDDTTQQDIGSVLFKNSMPDVQLDDRSIENSNYEDFSSSSRNVQQTIINQNLIQAVDELNRKINEINQQLYQLCQKRNVYGIKIALYSQLQLNKLMFDISYDNEGNIENVKSYNQLKNLIDKISDGLKKPKQLWDNLDNIDVNGVEKNTINNIVDNYNQDKMNSLKSQHGIAFRILAWASNGRSDGVLLKLCRQFMTFVNIENKFNELRDSVCAIDMSVTYTESMTQKFARYASLNGLDRKSAIDNDCQQLNKLSKQIQSAKQELNKLKETQHNTNLSTEDVQNIQKALFQCQDFLPDKLRDIFNKTKDQQIGADGDHVTYDQMEKLLTSMEGLVVTAQSSLNEVVNAIETRETALSTITQVVDELRTRNGSLKDYYKKKSFSLAAGLDNDYEIIKTQRDAWIKACEILNKCDKNTYTAVTNYKNQLAGVTGSALVGGYDHEQTDLFDSTRELKEVKDSESEVNKSSTSEYAGYSNNYDQLVKKTNDSIDKLMTDFQNQKCYVDNLVTKIGCEQKVFKCNTNFAKKMQILKDKTSAMRCYSWSVSLDENGKLKEMPYYFNNADLYKMNDNITMYYTKDGNVVYMQKSNGKARWIQYEYCRNGKNIVTLTYDQYYGIQQAKINKYIKLGEDEILNNDKVSEKDKEMYKKMTLSQQIKFVELLSRAKRAILSELDNTNASSKAIQRLDPDVQSTIRKQIDAISLADVMLFMHKYGDFQRDVLGSVLSKVVLFYDELIKDNYYDGLLYDNVYGFFDRDSLSQVESNCLKYIASKLGYAELSQLKDAVCEIRELNTQYKKLHQQCKKNEKYGTIDKKLIQDKQEIDDKIKSKQEEWRKKLEIIKDKSFVQALLRNALSVNGPVESVIDLNKIGRKLDCKSKFSSEDIKSDQQFSGDAPKTSGTDDKSFEFIDIDGSLLSQDDTWKQLMMDVDFNSIPLADKEIDEVQGKIDNLLNNGQRYLYDEL